MTNGPKEPKEKRDIRQPEEPEHGPPARDPDGQGAPPAGDPTEWRQTVEEAPRE
ncbi:MAG: hypothetical protein ACXWUG_18330 [Polyangiales bacterium]